MKKFLKIIAVVGVIIFVACFAVLFFKFCNNGFKFDKILPQTQMYENKVFEQKVEANSLVVTYNDQVVEIEKSCDDAIHVYYTESQDVTFEFTTEDNIFYIKEVDSRNVIEKNVSLNFKNQTIKIQLPSCFSEDIKLMGDNGGISMTGQTVKNAFLKVNNGRVKIVESVVANELNVDTNNCGVNFETVKANVVDVETDNGEVVLKDCEFKVINVETDNGAISIERLKSDEIKLQTDNGAIFGSIIGVKDEYTIFATTHNGRKNLTDRVGACNGKVLTAETHNGEININFIES